MLGVISWSVEARDESGTLIDEGMDEREVVLVGEGAREPGREAEDEEDEWRLNTMVGRVRARRSG